MIRKASCQQQYMQAACTEALPVAAPANNDGCERHAQVLRCRQLLPAKLHESHMR
jgi:hypothetical protein